MNRRVTNLLVLMLLPNFWCCRRAHDHPTQGLDLSKVNLEFEDIATSEDAAKEYAETLAEPHQDKPLPCGFGDAAGYQCFEKEQDEDGTYFYNYYAAPFPLSFPQRIPPGPGNRFRFKWIPVTEAYRGVQTVAEWKDLASSGRLSACKGPDCIAIVAAHFRPEKPNEEVLEACKVLKIAGAPGAPWDCHPIAILGSDRTWVRAFVSYWTVLKKAGLADFDMKLACQPLPGLPSVLTAAENALKEPPLKLVAEKITSTAVAGKGIYRLSSVLPGWRELFTVRADVEAEYCYTDEGRCLGVTISTTLYVNRQNTDRPDDWHLPSEEQEHVYLDAVRSSLEKPFESLCSKAALEQRSHPWYVTRPTENPNLP